MVRVYPIIHPDDVIADLAVVERILETGVQYIQLRGGSAEKALRAGRVLRPIASVNGVTLIVNDRADLATLLGAGLHLGQDDLPYGDARALLGPDAAIGISTHDFRQATVAATLAPTYLSVGPVFPTASKRNASPVLGVELLKTIVAALDAEQPRHPPVCAIGGITVESACACLAAGADYLAMIGALRDASTGRLRKDSAEIIKGVV